MWAQGLSYNRLSKQAKAEVDKYCETIIVDTRAKRICRKCGTNWYSPNPTCIYCQRVAKIRNKIIKVVRLQK